MEEIRMWKEECHKESDRVAELKQRIAELEDVCKDIMSEAENVEDLGDNDFRFSVLDDSRLAEFHGDDHPA
jgi:hypothetical protein